MRIAAAAAAAAALTFVPQAATRPSNLCTLRLGPQLQALGVSSNCLWTRTTPNSARWGLVTRGVSVTVWRRLSRSAFESRFGGSGTPVAVGSFAREQAQPLTVTVNAWAHGVGFSVDVIDEGSSGGPSSAAVLALARSLARHL